jgi:hypothetical protein
MAIAPPRRLPRVGRPRIGPLPHAHGASLVALALGALVAYAAFADGAVDLPPGARLEVAVAAVALLALAVLLFTPRVRARAGAGGWAGIGLLLAFAVWTGVSIAWSIAADGTWAQLNRVLAYVLVLAIALVVGSSLPRALERAAIGFLVIATAVALYALGGKAAPGLHVGGLIDLNHTAFFSRLRAPLAYWNALALFCVLAAPIAVRAATDPAPGRRGRSAPLVSLVLLLVTIGLTYSRGGVAALAVALIVLLAVGPARARVASVVIAGLAGAAPALAVGFTRPDLTGDLVPLARRAGDGALFAGALVAGVVVAIVVARVLEQRVERVRPASAGTGRGVRIAAGGAAAAVVIALGVLAASDRGVVGTVSHGFESFKSVKYERQNDPARILQTNSGNRWVWWSEAVGAWADRPLQGWGAGSFPILHFRYRHNTLEVLQPHSVPLQLLAELGVVGALLALGALALLVAAGWTRVAAGMRSERAGVAPGREHRYATALLAAVAAWLVHMWFDWDWDIPGVALPLMAFLGLLAARPLGMPGLAPAVARGNGVDGRRIATLVLGAALCCAVAVSAALPSLARDHARAATGAIARGDFREALRQADIARRLDPVGVDALLIEARAAGRRGQFALASNLLTEAARRQPDSSDVWRQIALLELARGDIPKMRTAAHRMLVLDPALSFGRVFFFYNDLGVRSATATGTPLPPATPQP